MIRRIRDRRRKTIVCPTGALMVGACLVLTAQTPGWKEFSIGPPTHGAATYSNNVRQGALRSNAISLASLIAYAAGVPTARVNGPAWMATERFAVTAILGDETHERLRTRTPEETTIADEFRAALTRELELRFHLEYHRQYRDIPTYTLRAAGGRRQSLVPSTAHERGKMNLNTSAMTHGSTLTAQGVTFETIGGWLQGYVKEPVTVDPSLPDTPFDIHLKWQTNDRASLVAALTDQLGLELAEETSSLEYVVVDQVERLNRAAAPAPAPAVVVAASKDSAVTFTPAELRKDLQVLRESLEEGDPGIYRYTPKAEMDRAFDGAAKELDRSMTALEFYRALAPVVARIKCGHTVLQPSRGIQQRVAAEPLIPFETAVLGGKVYVERDFSQGGKLAGAEIVSINEVPIERILASMLAVAHGDGDSATAGPYQLSHERGFARNLYLIAGLQSPFRIAYSLGDTSGETLLAGMTVNSMREVENSRYPRTAPSANATWRMLDGGVGVLRIRSFEGKAEDGSPLSAFFASVFTELHEKKVAKLIVDVRDSSGGEDQLGRELYAYLADQAFRYYGDVMVNKHIPHFLKYVPGGGPAVRAREMVIQQTAAPHFVGKVVALMNGGNFSTACEFLATLHNHGGATFVGEETAGGYYGDRSWPEAQVSLPNSKLTVSVPLVGHYLAIDGDAQGAHGVRPDYPVEDSVGDILAGQDRGMETALRLAGR
jgi:uncharacterized protein (TIGR03435 family)